jgi:CRISPR type III-A-associated RAMP protein Csm5
MASFLKHYKLTLTTVGPVFIGSGEKRTAKEYYQASQIIYFPDMEKLYADMVAKRKARAFEEFILNTPQGSGRPNEQIRAATRLNDWLQRQGWDSPDTKAWGGYGVKLGNLEAAKGRYDLRTKQFTPGTVAQLNDILAFIKDGYGKPYVPGSSVKGLLRTMVLESLVCQQEAKQHRPLTSAPQRPRDTRAAGPLEAQFLRRLARERTRPDDAVNDLFQAVRVADSPSFPLQYLAVCQKIDLSAKGGPVGLPLYREVLLPGVKIEADITVDTQLAGQFTVDRWIASLPRLAAQIYADRYAPYTAKFEETAPKGLVLGGEGPYVYFAGGAGFRSKTVVNNQETMARILDNQFARRDRDGEPRGVPHADKTKATGVSPLVLKLTKLDGKYYEMGKCKLAIEPVEN